MRRERHDVAAHCALVGGLHAVLQTLAAHDLGAAVIARALAHGLFDGVRCRAAQNKQLDVLYHLGCKGCKGNMLVISAREQNDLFVERR